MRITNTGTQAISSRTHISRCPACAHQPLRRKRSLVGLIGGWLLLMLGFLTLLPTLGASVVICIFGVFMMVPRTRCPSCGWSKRS